jgi:hypothetical protein
VSLFEVQRLIHRLNVEPGTVEEFRADPAALLAEHALDAAERRALVDGDLAALWRLGVHPLLMLHYARARGVAGPRFYEQLRPLAGERKLVSAREP